MPLTLDLLFQQLQDQDEKHEEAHRRLRVDLRAVEERAGKLEGAYAGHMATLDELKGKPVDVAALRFTPSVVAMILSLALSVWGGVWAATYGLRSDMRDILTRMDMKEKAEVLTVKLQDERAKTLSESLDAMKRRQELQQYEIQGLKETILQGRAKDGGVK